jgi:hypothetical protein
MKGLRVKNLEIIFIFGVKTWRKPITYGISGFMLETSSQEALEQNILLLRFSC